MSHVPVFVRVRPLNTRETKEGATDAWLIGDNSLHCALAGKDTTSFCVNEVFGQASRTQDVFDTTAKGIVEHALQGYSGTVFAYGQTSSGKTHTMMGGGDEKGIVQLALAHMWCLIRADTEADYIVRVLSLEVYNEKLSDLRTNEELRIVEEKGNDPILKRVNGSSPGATLQPIVVSSADEAAEEVRNAMERRHVGQTNMNDVSSRSHTIFRFQIDRMPKNNSGERTLSLLHMVDLAGAESMKKTGATGARAHESSNINKSLSALVRVIHCLSERKAGQYIPFRDSKLTRLLRTSLGGNTKTAIVCCVTGASTQYDQTASTLRFAQEAAKVKNDPKRCVIREGDIPPALRKTLQKMAEAQTAEAREQHRHEVAELMEEMERLRQEQERHKTEIQQALETEREKRLAAETALQERGSRKRDSVSAETPAPKRARLQGEVDRLEAELLEMREKLSSAENAPNDASVLREEIAQLRLDLAAKRDQQQQQGTPRRSGSSEGGALVSTPKPDSPSAAVAAAAAAAALSEEVVRLEARCAALEELVQRREACLEAAKEGEAVAQKELSTAREGLAELQAQLQRGVEELGVARAGAEAAEAQRAQAVAEAAECQLQVEALRQQAERSAAYAEELAKDKLKVESQLASTLEKKQLLQHEAQHYEALSKRKQDELEKSMAGPLRTAHTELEKRFTAKKKENGDLRDENALLMKKVQILEADKDQLKKKVQQGGGGGGGGPATRRPGVPPPAKRSRTADKAAEEAKGDEQPQPQVEVREVVVREVDTEAMDRLKAAHAADLEAQRAAAEAKVALHVETIAKLRSTDTQQLDLMRSDYEDRIKRLQDRIAHANEEKAVALCKVEDLEDKMETQVRHEKRKLRKEFEGAVEKRAEQKYADRRAQDVVRAGAAAVAQAP